MTAPRLPLRVPGTSVCAFATEGRILVYALNGDVHEAVGLAPAIALVHRHASWVPQDTIVRFVEAVLLDDLEDRVVAS